MDFVAQNDENKSFASRSMEAKMHSMSMTGTIYMENIEKGTKTHEGRINDSKRQKMKVGDTVSMFDSNAGWGILCEITELVVCASFKEMLETVGVSNMLETSDISEGIATYRGFPGAEREPMGVVAIGVKFIKRI